MPTKLRVLYMEDDADAQELVAYLLESLSIDVAIVETVEEAESMAVSENFDIFLLDGILPFDNTLAFCQRLRAYAPEAPIIFYSAFATKNDINAGLNAGANHYVTKPFFGDLTEILLKAANDKNPANPSEAQETKFQNGHAIAPGSDHSPNELQ